MLAALSTGHKLGLGLVAALFIAFALAASFVLPRSRPDFPGPGRGLRTFLAVTVALFVGMLAAVEVFGAESEEPERHVETSGTTAQETTTPGKPLQTVKVSETEFKIRLATTHLRAGTYRFELTNDGKIAHDLTIEGPQVSGAKTPVIGPGKTAVLTAALVKGTYDFYCSVAGHKDAGMDAKVTVS